MDKTCHQRHICDSYIPSMRKALDEIEAGLQKRPHAYAPEDDACDVADTCGPLWWATLHAAVDSIGCEHCRGEAVRLMRGLHDVVSVKLGKPAQHPADLTFLQEMAAGKQAVAAARSVCSGSHRLPLRALKDWVQHAPLDHEVGRPVYPGGRLGVVSHGDYNEVKIIAERGCKPVAIVHTHPDGPLQLSALDIASAKAHGVPKTCVGVPGTRQLTCTAT